MGYGKGWVWGAKKIYVTTYIFFFVWRRAKRRWLRIDAISIEEQSRTLLSPIERTLSSEQRKEDINDYIGIIGARCTDWSVRGHSYDVATVDTATDRQLKRIDHNKQKSNPESKWNDCATQICRWQSKHRWFHSFNGQTSHCARSQELENQFEKIGTEGKGKKNWVVRRYGATGWQMLQGYLRKSIFSGSGGRRIFHQT